MKLTVISLGLLLATGAAYGQRSDRNSTDAIERACSVKECFLEADIRDFEVIDRTHLIVYVGQQRCAFHVELRGTMCDLTFAPELYFRRPNEIPDGRIPRGGEPASDRGLVDPFDPLESARRERRDLRVCGNDITIMVHGGRFTEAQSAPVLKDRFGEPRINTDCRVSNVTSITDDQLVEFYVARGVIAPVPPMGAGQIDVGEQEEQGSESPDRHSGDADEPH
jgi:hypothetical protein